MDGWPVGREIFPILIEKIRNCFRIWFRMLCQKVWKKWFILYIPKVTNRPLEMKARIRRFPLPICMSGRPADWAPWLLFKSFCHRITRPCRAVRQKFEVSAYEETKYTFLRLLVQRGDGHERRILKQNCHRRQRNFFKWCWWIHSQICRQR